MGSASPERSRSREAMADVPQESSRGNCCHGLLYSPNAQVWCSVLLFVIGHDRRKILHFNVTRNPRALWLCSIARSVGYKQPTDSCYSTETQRLEPMWFRL